MRRGAYGFLALSILLPAGARAQTLPRVAPEELGLSTARLRRVDDAFRGYVDEGRIAGAVGMVVRHGQVAYVGRWGMRDVAANDRMEADDIFRIMSMTKPVTSVAVMMLFEEGRFFLDDPVGRYLPELAGVQVARLSEATSLDDIPTERPRRPMTIRDLLRHTSGLTYGWLTNTRVDSLYNRAGVMEQTTLADMVATLGGIPLMYQPGTQWNYSASTDVLGRLVEVVSGKPFDVFLSERIFRPLGMRDTGFHVPPAKHARFARTYAHGRDRALVLGDTLQFLSPPTFLSGGGGLVSTAQDYARFAQMLLNGGELDGVRILGRKTIELMTMDHLGDSGRGWLSPGWGFGLGFTVQNEAGLDGLPGTDGTYYWFGLHGTSFWIDPAEDLIGVFMVQIYPSRDIAFRNQFKSLVYQAIVG